MSHNIFISWSKDRSLQVAKALNDWLPSVIQAAKPWFSPNDIEKGTSWSTEIARSLSMSKVGIFCLTPENLNEPWINFEAGAISNKKDEARIWTFLFPEMAATSVKGPLGQFNHTSPDKDDIQKLLRSVRDALDLELTDDRLARALDKNWCELEAELKRISALEVGGPPPKRPLEDMIEELLEMARADARNRIKSSRPPRLEVPLPPEERLERDVQRLIRLSGQDRDAIVRFARNVGAARAQRASKELGRRVDEVLGERDKVKDNPTED